ncbi:MAG: thioredoxin [Dorea sp.]|nr:thioredoxin [Dorea sp.]MDY2812523.1 thioredoxin domain-containing protein [Dorea sp.]
MLHLTAKNFETEARKSPVPTVVMFYAIWCGKCAMMKPVVEEIEKKYSGQIKFCEVEIDESAVLAAEYEADIIPTFVFFKNQKILSVMRGVIEETEFERRLQKIFRNS